MLNKNEKRLLNILGIVVLLIGCGFFLFLKTQELNQIERKINQTIKSIKISGLGVEDEVELPGKIRELEVQIQKEKVRFYQPGEMSFSIFAQTMETLIKGNGLKLKKYKPVEEKEQTYYEYDLEGSAIQAMNLLYDIHKSPKYLTVREFAIKSPKINGRTELSIKVTYNVYNTLNSTTKSGKKTSTKKK